MSGTGLAVLTVNLWFSERDAEQRLRALAGFVAATAPDVVCCQEVTEVTVDGRAASVAAHVADLSGWRVVADEQTGRDGVAGEGLAVLVAPGVAAEPRPLVPLPATDADHPRALQRVDVALPGGGLVRVGNTHLSWHLEAGGARSAQADAVIADLAGEVGPAVVAGDLNDVPGSAALGAFAEAGFVDAYAVAGGPERPTFGAENPYIWQPELVGRRVDHVLARGVDIASARIVLDGRDGPVVSDHYGVRADLLTRPDRPGSAPTGETCVA